jgi:hypothetical protein
VIGNHSEIFIPLRARFSDRVLSEIASASSAPGQSAHERYLEVFEVVRDKDKEPAMLFDNPRRSNALAQLSAIASAGLVTDEERPGSRQKPARQPVSLLRHILTKRWSQPLAGMKRRNVKLESRKLEAKACSR